MIPIPRSARQADGRRACATDGGSEGPNVGGGGGDQADQQGRLRDQAGRQRDTAAGLRDDRSARRDEAVQTRDEQARRRSEALQQIIEDLKTAGVDGGGELARMVEAADSDRAFARVDRVAAGNDRADAATDRQEALADRMAAARDAGTLPWTGVYNREAGLLDLPGHHGLDSCRSSHSWTSTVLTSIPFT